MSDSHTPFQQPRGTRYAWEHDRNGSGFSGELHDAAGADTDAAPAGEAANGRGRRAEAGDSELMGGASNTPLANDSNVIFNDPVSDLASPRAQGDFLNCLKVDTCVLSARGRSPGNGYRWKRGALAFDLEGVQETAKRKEQNQLWEIELDGATYEFEVYPHGTEFHDYLLRSPELAVTVQRSYRKMDNMPDVAVRFGARWFLRHTLEETRDFFRQLCRKLGLWSPDYFVTDVHICADCTHALTYDDLRHMRGNGTGGNCSHKTHHAGRHVTGVSNYGNGLRYVIYDKSREVRKKNQTHYRVAMRQHGLNPATDDVWRVEVRARRSWLKSKQRHFGIDALGELNWPNLRKLWGYFTSSYLRFTRDTVGEERGDRTQDLEWWDRLNALAGEDFRRFQPPARPARRQGENVDANFRQAVGCAASSVAESGAELAGTWLEEFCERLSGEAGELTRERFEEKAREEINAQSQEIRAVLESPGENWYVDFLTDQLMQALEGKASASAHTHDPHNYQR